MTSGQLHIQPNTMEMANSNQNSQETSNGMHYKQELLAKGRKRKTTALVLGVVLLLLVAATVVYFLSVESEPIRTAATLTGTHRSIPLNSILKGELSLKRFNGTWISDHEILFKGPDGSIKIFDATRLKTRVLLTGDFDILRTSFFYELSADKKFLVLAHGYQKLYRYTYLAYYHVVDLETGKHWPVTDTNGDPILLQLFKWAPMGNAFVYVFINDIYYRPYARETADPSDRLTNTGRPSIIYNGVPDWVYEEEILSSNSALWFSPDGGSLVYATFNDSKTPVMNIPFYGTPGDMKYQYTQSINIRYPKPGRANPVVSLTLVKLTGTYEKSNTIDISPTNVRDPVLTYFAWASPSEFLVVWMNRVQNFADIVLCKKEAAECRIVLTMLEKSGWVSVPKILFSPQGNAMALIYPYPQEGDAGDYNHLAIVDLISNKPMPIPLTHGKFVVTDLLTWDNEDNIYFLSNTEENPGELRLNRIQASGGGSRAVECISCKTDQHLGSKCKYAGATFSKNASFFMQTCAGPTIPEVDLFNKAGEKLMVWENNRIFKERLKGSTLPESEVVEVPIADGMTAYAKLLYPPGIDRSGNTKYPLLVQVYAGPDTNQVLEKFSLDWYTYLIVNQSIIYAMIDARGSGLKGNKLLFSNYKQLGTYEIYDQINITKYLQETRGFIDKKRTGIWGWSYGGYATGMVLTNDTEGVFKCGVSVAPVSDWLLYDTLYTERFMGLPTIEDNLYGYEKASLNNKVDNFKKKEFLLIHGTLDDNVHYQQSMMLAKALELNNILFEQQTYPDEGHGLNDVRPHLYHSLQHFLQKCFDLPQDN